MRVLIVGSSKLPIPAVKGGAVPNLIEELIAQNEKESCIDLSCLSLYNEDAEEKSKKYSRTHFIWAKTPNAFSFIDSLNYVVLSKIFRLKRLLSVSFIFQIIWMILFTAYNLKKNDYDRVVFENSIPVLFSLRLFGNRKKYNGKCYLHMHSVPRKYFGNEQIVRGCASVICISDYVAKSMHGDKRLRLPLEKTTIMYNCVDTDLFRPMPIDESLLKEKLGISESQKILLFVGRLCPEKGIVETLSALKKLKRSDLTLLIVGSNFYGSKIVSPYEEHLRQLCDDMKENVRFTGYINYWELPEYYALADVVVLPSMWDEPAGMTIIEAMACGKPVITTRSGGIPEYVAEDNCILLDRDESLVENLSLFINVLLDDVEYARELSCKAHRCAERFNSKFYFDQLKRIVC